MNVFIDSDIIKSIGVAALLICYFDIYVLAAAIKLLKLNNYLHFSSVTII